MRAAKIDANQPAVVRVLRQLGVSVQHLHTVGAGCPDLLCALNGHCFLIEVKDGSKPPSKQVLTPDQVDWHAAWNSKVHVINSITAAVEVVQHYMAMAA